VRYRARRWREDAEIQALAAEAGDSAVAPSLASYSPQRRDELLGTAFDRVALAQRGRAYERLDQLTMDILLGVRT
jgi:xylose isomerase